MATAFVSRGSLPVLWKSISAQIASPKSESPLVEHLRTATESDAGGGIVGWVWGVKGVFISEDREPNSGRVRESILLPGLSQPSYQGRDAFLRIAGCGYCCHHYRSGHRVAAPVAQPPLREQCQQRRVPGAYRRDDSSARGRYRRQRRRSAFRASGSAKSATAPGRRFSSSSRPCWKS